MTIAAALLALCVPALFAVGSVEHHAGRKGTRWTIAACVIMGMALGLAWGAGREHGRERFDDVSRVSLQEEAA